MNTMSDRRRARAMAIRSAVVCCVLAAVSVSAYAGSREQAKRIHERLTGVAPPASVLTAMETDVAGGNATQAAFTAMQAPSFYNVTLKNFVTPWTNRDQTVFAPLNDYTATVIGMVRDDVDFRTLLSADLVYVGQGINPAGDREAWIAVIPEPSSVALLAVGLLVLGARRRRGA